MVSLLYPNSFEHKSNARSICVPLYRFAELTIADASLRSTFCSVASIPLTNSDLIKYRQHILNDLYGHLDVYNLLYNRVSNIICLKSDYDEAKKKFFGIATQTNDDNDINRLVHILQTNALFLKQLLATVKDLDSILGEKKFYSTGLNAFAAYMNRFVNNESFSILFDYCKTFEHYYPSESTTDFLIKLDGFGKISSVNMIVHKKARIEGRHKKTGLFSYIKKVEQKSINNKLSIYCHNSFENNTIRYTALNKVTYALEVMIKRLLDDFSIIKKELDFYEASVRILDVLRKAGLRLTYPIIGTSTTISGLIDPVLWLEKLGSTCIISNDFDFSNQQKGLIIIGDNGVGKTVYLRAVLLAHILAQTGLPIPAESAVINPKNAFLYFEAGSEDKNDTNKGRFEEEIERLSNIIDLVSDNDVVFLNEPLQSTSDDVASKILLDIFDYLAKKGCVWMLVTHLTSIKSAVPNDFIKIVEFNPDHKLKLKLVV